MSIIVYQTTSVQRAPLGEEHTEGAGIRRVYRYAKNGPVALAAGTFIQGAVNESGHSDLSVTSAVAVTARKITVTSKNVKIDTDDYKDGFIYINDADGQGYVYDVLSNTSAPAAEAGNPCVVTIEGELAAALTTSSKATLLKNPYDECTLPFLKPFAPVAGVTVCPVPANHYFWLQVRGPASVLQEGTLYAGKPVMISNKVRGAAALAKQIIPALTKNYGEVGMPGSSLTEPVGYVQEALQPRITFNDNVTTSPELLTEISGIATLPETVLGYVLDPRVDTDYALIDLRIA